VKRSRRGGRRPQNGSGGGGQHSYNPNRTFDSSGPEIKIRGSAANVYEKYLQLARDANTAGDRVMAENYLQHAEHYFRILAAAQAQQQQYQQNQNNRSQNGSGDQPYPQQGGSEAQFSLTENGNGGEAGNDEEEEGESEEAAAE